MLLAAGKLSTSDTDHSFHSLRVLAVEFPGVRLDNSILDFVVSGVRFVHLNVLLDRGVEQDGLLANVADLLAVVAKVDVF